MKSPTSWLAWLLALVLQVPDPAVAGTGWEQFGGPQRDLTIDGSGLFDQDTFALRVVWKRSLGLGYSGFSVVGRHAVTLFSEAGSDQMIALDAATGDEIWRHAVGPTYRGHSGSDDGPSGSPTIHGELVYAVSRPGQLLAVELATGDLAWSLDLPRQLGSVPPHYGFSTSPLVHDGVLIVQAGGPDGKSVVGLDPKDGRTLWSAGDDRVDHQSPLLGTLAGQRLLLAVGQRDVMALRPADGHLLWRHTHRSAEPEVWAQPVLAGENGLFLSYYFDDGIFFRITPRDGGVAVEEAWRSDLLKRSYVVPIYHQGYLYGFRGNLLFCVDPATGEPVWTSREPGNGGTILVDGHLITLAPRGHLVVTEVSPEGFEEKTRTPVLSRGSLTPPSLAAERLFVRNLSEAACLEIDRPAVSTSHDS